MFKMNVVTVNYKTDDFINNLIYLFKKEKGIFINFVIVDNSNDFEIDDLRKEDNFKINIIRNDKRYDNILNSHRGGLDLALKSINRELEFTMFIDPDVVFTEESLGRCLSYMRSNNLDCFGINKFYQWHKILPEIKLPYIWFTFIKTKYLKNFCFKINIFDKIKRRLKMKAVRDTGDRIYFLVENKKLKYKIIKKYPKNIQKDYIFKDFNTDDWRDDDLRVLVSHYRAGSKERNFQVHGENYLEKQKDFIEKSREFFF